jgi:hypothetical protein
MDLSLRWTNDCSAHRHAAHALEDFIEIRSLLKNGHHSPEQISSLLHSLSHHLRHAVFRSGERVPPRWRVIPERETRGPES